MQAARGATPDDIAHVVSLARRLRAEVSTHRGGELWTHRDARHEPLDGSYAALLDRGDAFLAVGTIDGASVGFGVAEIEPLAGGGLLGVITDLYVEPGARGVGVGEALLAILTGFCDEMGCVGVDALALPGHRAAKNFFEEAGFTARLLVMHRRGSATSGDER